MKIVKNHENTLSRGNYAVFIDLIYKQYLFYDYFDDFSENQPRNHDFPHLSTIFPRLSRLYPDFDPFLSQSNGVDR